jgi:hypothetical protein
VNMWSVPVWTPVSVYMWDIPINLAKYTGTKTEIFLKN